jgi:hypothetical protein
MAVAIDVISSGLVQTDQNSGTNSNTSMASISASATMAVAIVEASLHGDPDTNITNTVPTLGGVTMTVLSGSLKHSGTDSDTAGYVVIYTLASPPTGTQTFQIVPTYTGGAGEMNLNAVCATFTGALAGSPLGTAKTVNSAGSASSTITDTLAAGDLFIGGAVNGTDVLGLTTGTTVLSQIGSTNTGSHGRLWSARNSGTGSVSIVWSQNSGDFAAASGVKIIASTGAAFIAPPPLVISQAVKTASYW